MREKQAAWWQLWQYPSTPLNHDSQPDTRGKLMNAAYQEIHKVGFHKASLSNILKQTDLSKGALYYHFPNKRALGYAVIDEILRQFIEIYWIKPISNTNEPIQALKNCMNETAQHMTDIDIEMGCPLNNLSQEMSMSDEGFRLRIESIYEDWREAIQAAIKRGIIHQSVKSNVNPEQFSIVFIATLEGCLGLAKSAQSLPLLYSCGQGLNELLDFISLDNEHHGKMSHA